MAEWMAAFGMHTRYCTVFSTGTCDVPVARAGGVHVGFISIVIRFAAHCLYAGDSGVRTRNGIYNDVYDGGTHQIHGQTPQCGIRLWTPGIRASADALRGRDPRRLWLTVQRSGMVGIRGRGAAATGAQQESSRASANRIPTRIWSSPSLPDLELKASQVSAQ